MVKYRAALWSLLKLTALVFYHVWHSPWQQLYYGSYDMTAAMTRYQHDKKIWNNLQQETATTTKIMVLCVAQRATKNILCSALSWLKVMKIRNANVPTTKSLQATIWNHETQIRWFWLSKLPFIYLGMPPHLKTAYIAQCTGLNNEKSHVSTYFPWKVASALFWL